MLRFFLSLWVGLGIGIVVGLFFGWEISPAEFVDSPMSSLAPRYQDTYTVMIAAGYAEDEDAFGALERLRVLGVENVPEHIQSITERYITNSRDQVAIRELVALSEAFGRITPIMEPFRQISIPGEEDD